MDIEEVADDERSFRRIAQKTGMDAEEIGTFVREVRPVIYGGRVISAEQMKLYIDKMSEIINHIKKKLMEENTEQRIDLTLFSEKIQGLKERIASVIVGQEQTVDLVLTAILANGHVLIEGVPGVAKTLLARLTARLIDADFSRIQFTPGFNAERCVGNDRIQHEDE